MSFKGFMYGTASVGGEMAGNLLDKIGVMKREKVKSTTRIDRKTVILTGGNRGIGLEVARELARRGGRIIMGVRDPVAGKSAVDLITSETPGAQVFIHKLDLASIESIHYFSNAVLEMENNIDYLINNAGLISTTKKNTKDGFEMNFGVNHLGHFLLTLILLDRMKRSPLAKIVNVGSVAHLYPSRIDFDDLLFSNKKWSYMEAYGTSKLSIVTMTVELAKRLPSNVHVYCIDPGFVKTDLFRENPSMFTLPVLSQLYRGGLFVSEKIWFRQPSQGAQPIIHCITSPEADNETGLYYGDNKPKKCSKIATDPDVAKKLWEVSCDLAGLPLFKNKQQL